MVPYGSLWVPMGLYGSLWGSMGLYGSLCVSVGPYDALWVSMGPYGSLCLYVSLWVPMVLYASLWISMGPYGALWVSMGPCGSLWIPMGPYHPLTCPPPLCPTASSSQPGSLVWDDRVAPSLVRNGVVLRRNKLVVPRDGLYFVYAAAAFQGGGRCFIPPLRLSVSRFSEEYPKDVPLLTAVRSVCPGEGGRGGTCRGATGRD